MSHKGYYVSMSVDRFRDRSRGGRDSSFKVNVFMNKYRIPIKSAGIKLTKISKAMEEWNKIDIDKLFGHGD
jgi:hypothetical protein